MARYNLWQNENLTVAASALNDMERNKERGAFFGSIQKTFSHIFWGDQIWLSRFAGTEAPTGGISASLELIEDWDAFRSQRSDFDRRILAWAHNVKPEWFQGDLVWFSGMARKQMNKPKNLAVMQLFNHQTHHRGQIHAMLTAAGVKPADTDIHIMPEQYLNM
jgi:uncharacterized damage-inducible protein DinB